MPGFFLHLSPGKPGNHPMSHIQGVRVRGWGMGRGLGLRGVLDLRAPYAVRIRVVWAWGNPGRVSWGHCDWWPCPY